MNRWRKRIMTWLTILVSLYVVYCGLLFFFQTKLIFPASMAGQPSQSLPTADTEVIEFSTEEGTTVSWFVPAPGASNKPDEPRPLAAFFHGNAELIDHQTGIIDLYHGLGIHVLLVEYRGYGHSDGTPSQEHIVTDSVAVMRDILKREDVDADKIVLHGRSIGGGLAAQVALQTDPAVLIVESTFASVSGMALRYGAPPFLVRSPLDSKAAFKEMDMPILIMHGKADTMIPVNQAETLQATATNAKLVLFDAHHNNLPNGPEVETYRYEVKGVLERAGIFD
ncbi:MAG: alpha/beta hydrolase [Planctomycetota bacterium]